MSILNKALLLGISENYTCRFAAFAERFVSPFPEFFIKNVWCSLIHSTLKISLQKKSNEGLWKMLILF